MSEAGDEMKFLKEAFDTNWVVPIGLNVDSFKKDIEKFLNHKDGIDAPRKRVITLSTYTRSIRLEFVNFDN